MFCQRAAGALVVAAAGGVASLPTTRAQQPKKRQLRKAIMLGTVGGKHSVLEKFQMIKAAGFEGVEPNSHMDQAEVLQARDKTGLEIASVCDAIHWSKTLSDPNPAVREVGLDGLRTALKDAKAYGATSVLLVPAVVNKQVSYADAYTRSQAEIRKAVPLAEDLGVAISIENVWNEFLLSPMEAARYVDEFNSRAVGFHFDIGNIITFGWPEHWIRILGPRIRRLHIKEFSRKKRNEEGLGKGFAVDYLEGDNDWPGIMRALDEVGYRGWAIAEPAYTPPGVEVAARLHQVSEKLDRIFAS
jgi:hexulose-6-phosphate isomerase